MAQRLTSEDYIKRAGLPLPKQIPIGTINSIVSGLEIAEQDTLPMTVLLCFASGYGASKIRGSLCKTRHVVATAENNGIDLYRTDLAFRHQYNIGVTKLKEINLAQ